MSTLFAASPDERATTEWPLRAWGLAVLGALAGLALHLLIEPGPALREHFSTEIRTSAATFVCVSAAAFAFLVRRPPVKGSVAFAILSGAVVALATYWNGPYGGRSYEDPWRLACALLCVSVAAPIYQARRDHHGVAPGAFAIPYDAAYHHAWTNVILWCAAWTFVGAVWLMAFLLAALFDLIGIGLLSDLLEQDWLILVLSGTALGSAIGLLRDREHILGLLQRVVTTVLSVLAPVLATGLAIFLLALPFTGLASLWQATRSTTPILLSCVIGALCLANAGLNDSAAREARHPVLRGSILILCLAILPLSVIAALSTASRIDQHGLTPDRLWAVVFTSIACIFGAAYLVSITRGRRAAAAHLRTANLRLVVGLAVVALVLSTPLVNFGALSTADQVARLRNGTMSAEQFDWRALRFDFGHAGVEATRELAQHGATPAIRAAAADVLKAKSRWEGGPQDPQLQMPAVDPSRLVILPRPVPLPPQLTRQLSRDDACGHQGPCAVVHQEGSAEAIVVQGSRAYLWSRQPGEWSFVRAIGTGTDSGSTAASDRAVRAGEVEVRAVTARQVFVGGKALGDPFR